MKYLLFLTYRTTSEDCDEQLDLVFDELISEEDDGMFHPIEFDFLILYSRHLCL